MAAETLMASSAEASQLVFDLLGITEEWTVYQQLPFLLPPLYECTHIAKDEIHDKGTCFCKFKSKRTTTKHLSSPQHVSSVRKTT